MVLTECFCLCRSWRLKLIRYYYVIVYDFVGNRVVLKKLHDACRAEIDLFNSQIIARTSPPSEICTILTRWHHKTVAKMIESRGKKLKKLRLLPLRKSSILISPKRKQRNFMSQQQSDVACFDNYSSYNIMIRCLLQSLRNMANTTDACEIRDPCQHGGICISTDSGPICECRNGDYEGAYCEKG
jgi:leucine-rich repeat transmembrane neuronal protein 1/2